jgi:predicted dehydrogenase
MNMSESMELSRRGFLAGAATAIGAPWIVPSSALGLGDAPPPSDRVALGGIGAGVRGALDLRTMAGFGARIVAVSDVRRTTRETALAEFKLTPADGYNDFRRLLDRKDVDAVLVAPPDHWHVLIGIAAIKAGKDLYLEKPLGVTIDEGKAILKAVRESDRVFMHGTEQRGMPDVRKMCELVRNGRIGKLRSVTVACPGGAEIPAQPDMPVPDGFDYDLWLGPARKAPYTERRCQQPDFFHISDYVPAGFLCSWGVHHLDIAQWGMGMDGSGPVEIEGKATFPKKGSLSDTPLTWKVEYAYANGARMTFTDASANPEGVLFEGTTGSIFKAYRVAAKAKPEGILDGDIGPDELHLYATDCDDHCFLECVKSRKETCSPIEAAHRSTTVGYLGHIAILLGRKLRWDPEKEIFPDDPEANRLLSREMRAPWKIAV